jgi:hypothetical protein
LTVSQGAVAASVQRPLGPGPQHAAGAPPTLPCPRVPVSPPPARSAVQAHIDAGADASNPRGAVRQALSAALQRELTEFYGFLAGLEQQLAHPLPAPGAFAFETREGRCQPGPAEAAAELAGREAEARRCPTAGLARPDPAPFAPSRPAGCTDEAVLSAPFLTLRRLLLWTGEPLRRMRLLAALADGTAGAGGGALAGMVWGHTKRGDPLARAYATRLLQQVRPGASEGDASGCGHGGARPRATPSNVPLLHLLLHPLRPAPRQVCVPLFDQIRRWVFEGRLLDPHLEFFIVQQAALPAGGGGGEGAWRDPWREGYRIEASKLPPFISRCAFGGRAARGEGPRLVCSDSDVRSQRAAAPPLRTTR